MQALRLTAAGHSQTGKRTQNEDNFCLHPDLQPDLAIFVVADGMGGLQAGEEASKLAVDLIPNLIVERIQAKDRQDEAVAIALEMVHQAILQKAQEDSKFQGMGTTAVVCLVTPTRVFIGNLGDSPAYLVRGTHVTRLTQDHTVTDELVRKGLLTAEQAKNHPWRNRLFKYLGCSELHELAEIHDYPPRPGDRLILTSDGVSNFIPDADYAATIAKYPNPQAAAEAFTQLALDRGTKDNVTSLVIAFD